MGNVSDLNGHIKEKKESMEFKNYLYIRDWVLRMKQIEFSFLSEKMDKPSNYWREELDGFNYMLDASPLIIEKLRHHCYHITGIHDYEYRSHHDARKIKVETRLQELIDAGAKELIVPEAKVLGGFGYTINDHLYNVDTLKFCEVLLGMEQLGLLKNFSDKTKKNLVWEIGGGWGGFAYQFKTLFSNTTYMIVDFSEVFIFSGVYLKTLFPNAKILLYEKDSFADALKNWQDYDFIFVPNTFFDEIKSIIPDLTINMVSFQEMTAEQVRNYVKKAAELKCPYLYSMNRDRSPHNNQLTNVRDIIKEYYSIEEHQILETSYVTAATAKGAKKSDKKVKPDHLGYRHVLGQLIAQNCIMDAKNISADSGLASPVSTIDDKNSLGESVSKTCSKDCKVGIGMTVYNGSRYLRKTLESILNQTYGDFILVIVDDASRDDSEKIIKEYAACDKRIFYHKNEEREGMVATWRKAFRLVSRNFPQAEYFAWASDHDIWALPWLAALVQQLDQNKQVVLTYPMTQKISKTDEVMQNSNFHFDTFGISDFEKRFEYICKISAIGAGNMVYGLFRVEALLRAGVFRRVLLPDRLLMFELSLQGEFKQIDEVLWFRRVTNKTTFARQRVSLFPNKPRPKYICLPWWLVFGVMMIKNYYFGEAERNKISKPLALRLAFILMSSQVIYEFKKKSKKIKDELKRFRTLLSSDVSSILKSKNGVWYKAQDKNYSDDNNASLNGRDKKRKMKILFIMLHPGYMRYYYTTLRALLERGDIVNVTFLQPKKQAKDRLHELLVESFPSQFTFDRHKLKRKDAWESLSYILAWGMDYLRYFTPDFKNATRLRQRVEVNIHPLFVGILKKIPFARSQFAVNSMIKSFRYLYNNVIPDARHITKFIKSHSPDVVIVSPLVTIGNLQSEYLKAAHKAKIPAVYCVASWDNLSSKGLIRGNPEKVIVWNDIQKSEAIKFHAISPKRIIVTGAQSFDEWFSRKPSISREEFAKKIGLPSNKPIMFYMCSSNFMAPNETNFVLNWIKSIRGSSIPSLAKCGILIRPYPEHVEQWKQVDLTKLEDVTLWPPDGEYPLSEEAKANFYDSIYHSKAVVGVNTSALIESSIIGRPVFTILAKELNDSQTNTIHFYYLLEEKGGFLKVAENFKENLKQLENIFEDNKNNHEKESAFISEFIRPHGENVPCVPLVADAIEGIEKNKKKIYSVSIGVKMLRLFLYPIAAVLNKSYDDTKEERQDDKKINKDIITLSAKHGVDPLERLFGQQDGKKH